MTLFFELRRRSGAAPLAADVLFGPLPGVLAPVVELEQLDPSQLLPEEVDSGEGTTRYDSEGSLLQGAAGDALHQGSREGAFACAALMRLPGADDLERVLRRRVGERWLPLVTLRVEAERIVLTFGEGEAPLALLPLETGPAWEDSAASLRTALANALREVEARGVDVRGISRGLSPAATALLDASFPGVTLDHAQPPGLVCRLSLVPGPCKGCRHANHGTDDLEHEGLLSCRLIGPRPGEDPQCEAAMERGGRTLYAYEPYSGANGTWGTLPLVFAAPRT